jgi:hypothetical protein
MQYCSPGILTYALLHTVCMMQVMPAALNQLNDSELPTPSWCLNIIRHQQTSQGEAAA